MLIVTTLIIFILIFFSNCIRLYCYKFFILLTINQICTREIFFLMLNNIYFFLFKMWIRHALVDKTTNYLYCCFSSIEKFIMVNVYTNFYIIYNILYLLTS